MSGSAGSLDGGWEWLARGDEASALGSPAQLSSRGGGRRLWTHSWAVAMNPHAVLAALQDHPHRMCWSASDVERRRGSDPRSVGGLATLVHQDALSALAADWYANPFGTYTAEALTGALLSPSYLSLEYALHFPNVLPQRSWSRTRVTTARGRSWWSTGGAMNTSPRPGYPDGRR